MRNTSIAKRRMTLVKRIHSIMEKMNALQEECTHPNCVSEHHSDTGNYCKQDDSYWTDHKCPDCGKHWTTPQ